MIEVEGGYIVGFLYPCTPKISGTAKQTTKPCYRTHPYRCSRHQPAARGPCLPNLLYAVVIPYAHMSTTGHICLRTAYAQTYTCTTIRLCAGLQRCLLARPLLPDLLHATNSFSSTAAACSTAAENRSQNRLADPIHHNLSRFNGSSPIPMAHGCGHKHPINRSVNETAHARTHTRAHACMHARTGAHAHACKHTRTAHTAQRGHAHSDRAALFDFCFSYTAFL